jgi:hypothetical protein
VFLKDLWQVFDQDLVGVNTAGVEQARS